MVQKDGVQKDGPFAGKAAVIIGGAKGIGRSVAIEWARRGATVAVADIDADAANAAAAEIEAAGGRATGFAVNVLDAASITAMADAVEAQFGLPHLVMSNVGAIVNGHPEDIPMAEWQRIMDLNYWGSMRALEHYLPRFLERGTGHIVNTASFAGLYPYAVSRLPYASAKAAVLSLTQNLAMYLEPMGIRVSCLIPGPVLTGVMESMTSWTENCPMRGPGSELDLKLPEEVAVRLSDGMHDGAIMIPSDDNVWTIVRQWAASPDAFLRERMAAFAAGDVGRPQVPQAIQAMFAKG